MNKNKLIEDFDTYVNSDKINEAYIKPKSGTRYTLSDILDALQKHGQIDVIYKGAKYYIPQYRHKNGIIDSGTDKEIPVLDENGKEIKIKISDIQSIEK